MLSNLISKKKTSLELHNPVWKNVLLREFLKEDLAFKMLPDKILNLLEERLAVFESYGSKEIIQTNTSVAKYINFIRRGGCVIELINGNVSYKDSLRTGQIYGWESLLSSTHRSAVTTNALMSTLSVRKNYIERIMDYFPAFEEAFWKENLFYLLKMYSSNKESSVFMSRLEKSKLL